jgi:hypothetical protein
MRSDVVSPLKGLCPVSRFHCLGQAEVQNLHRAVMANFDVRGLEIAMDDALFVRGFEGFTDLPRDRQCIGNRDRPARDTVGERRPLDQLHHEGLYAVRIFQPVNRCDVLVVQRRERTRLALEARQTPAILCESAGQHLDRDIALKPGVPGPIHLPHPAHSDLGADFIGAETSAGGQSHPATPPARIPIPIRPPVLPGTHPGGWH